MMKGADGLADTADDVLVEGNRAAPISLANAVRTGHQFLIDIAHSADPTGGLVADGDNVIGGAQPAGTYDNELLDAHYIAGDGRVNENIGLTAVHSIFHSEHNRLVDQTMQVALQSNDLAFLNQWLLPGTAPATFPTTQAQIDALQWNGERLFQAGKFGTEMQYQHLVFEEFARTIQPQVDEFLAPIGYDTLIDPVDRRGVRAHGLSLRPFDADRDGRPLRSQLQRRRHDPSSRQSADGPDRGLPEPARLRRQRPDAGSRRSAPSSAA